jgi:selenocysteine-specific elongation factor
MNAHLALGVIGHVDHGKTSLVKALSGIDTDRLKEEKERGMSIVLGFAHLDFGNGMIDLIDVPGHENFVRTMVAGATGIDAALLVVDVREGVKPQTAEHLAITELIGVQCGVIAITKCDLATGPERAAALSRLRSLLKGTYLEFAPSVFTSAATGEGMEELKHALKALIKQRMTPPAAAQFHLPIDRSFSIAGRGTVVTGTLRLGCIRAGDEVELMPGGMRTTVRQLEFHNRSVETAWPGQRVGVNLRHVKPQHIGRGDALASVGLLRASMLFDAELTLLKNQTSALKDGQTVRLLFGTTDVAARLRLLTGAALEPGRSGIAQLYAMRAVAAVAGEPFIIRSDSPPMTIGGGRFLDPVAARHRRSDPEVLPRLRILAHGSADETLTERLKGAGYAGIALSALAAILGVSEAQLHARLTDNIAAMIDETHVL